MDLEGDKSTPTLAVRTQLGVSPVQSHLVIKEYNNWLKILFMDPERLPKLYFKEQRHNMPPHICTDNFQMPFHNMYSPSNFQSEQIQW